MTNEYMSQTLLTALKREGPHTTASFVRVTTSLEREGRGELRNGESKK